MAHFTEIIKYGFAGMKESIGDSFGNKHILVLTLLALLYLGYFNRDMLKKLVIPVIVVALVVFNPVLYYYVYVKIIYWRLIWMIPNVILISIAASDVIGRVKNKAYKSLLLALMVIFIISAGTNAYKAGGFWKSTSAYKIPSDVIEISDAILEKDQHPRVIATGNLIIYGRMYEPEITMPYGRDVMGALAGFGCIIYSPKERKDLYYLMVREEPDYDYVLEYASRRGYNFIVNEEGKPINDALLERYGFELLDTIQGQNIYYNPDITEDSAQGWQMDDAGFKYYENGEAVTNGAREINGIWYYFNRDGYCLDDIDSATVQSIGPDDLIITQYGDDDDKDINMFYTIDDQKGNFIVVDGGMPNKEETVRNVIAKYNNKVDYWIITHPHMDHMGAFDRICQDPQGIEIGQIYSVDVDRDYFHEIANEWDFPEEFDLFYSILDEKDNVTYVERGKSYSIGSRDIKVYNTFTEESYDIKTGSLPNAASMVFKVEGEETSMLFLADIEAGNADLIYSIFGDELKSDYVQVAHHGQGIVDGYYEFLDPKMVFMDTPEWHRATEGKNSPSQHIAYFAEKDIPVMSYETTPNVLILK